MCNTETAGSIDKTAACCMMESNKVIMYKGEDLMSRILIAYATKQEQHRNAPECWLTCWGTFSWRIYRQNGLILRIMIWRL